MLICEHLGCYFGEVWMYGLSDGGTWQYAMEFGGSKLRA